MPAEVDRSRKRYRSVWTSCSWMDNPSCFEPVFPHEAIFKKAVTQRKNAHHLGGHHKLTARHIPLSYCCYACQAFPFLRHFAVYSDITGTFITLNLLFFLVFFNIESLVSDGGRQTQAYRFISSPATINLPAEMATVAGR